MIKDVFLYDKYFIWRNNGGSRWIVSHSADKNTENWKLYVRYTKWVSKYSSDWVGQEKYHNIPLKQTGFYKTGHNAQFNREIKGSVPRYIYSLSPARFLDYSVKKYFIENKVSHEKLCFSESKLQKKPLGSVFGEIGGKNVKLLFHIRILQPLLVEHKNHVPLIIVQFYEINFFFSFLPRFETKSFLDYSRRKRKIQWPREVCKQNVPRS